MRVLAALALILALAACDSSDPGVVQADSTVRVAYEGRLADGRVFDSNPGATFSLRGVIPGFRDGMIGMAPGETRTFTIPPDQAYGANPPRGSIIPPNAALTFEVELLEIL